MKTAMLYLVNILVWGCTWLAIKYQLGTVEPMVSVAYRFGSAAAILLFFCAVRKINLKFSLQEHLWMALLGIFLFSVNYWLIYAAEQYITSGLMAVVFSSIIFMNMFNSALFLKMPVEKMMVLGAVSGILGIVLIFFPEIHSFSLSDKSVLGILVGFASVVVASLGNIISAHNSRNEMPIIQSTAFGMAYGSVFMALVAAVTGKSFVFVYSKAYIGSLAYLSVFGSIIGFACYLNLIRTLGPGRASYAIVTVPAVALIVSWLFEAYNFTVFSFFGMGLVLLGSFFALGFKNNWTAEHQK